MVTRRGRSRKKNADSTVKVFCFLLCLNAHVRQTTSNNNIEISNIESKYRNSRISNSNIEILEYRIKISKFLGTKLIGYLSYKNFKYRNTECRIIFIFIEFFISKFFKP